MSPQDTDDDLKRLCRVVFHEERADSIVRGDFTVEPPLPDDARVHSWYTDRNLHTFEVIVRSSEFEWVPEGEIIPEWGYALVTDEEDGQ